MRKFIALLGAAAVLTIMPATPVLAEDVIIDIRDGICDGIVPDANGQLTGAHVTGTLFVRSNTSWVTMTCHFDLTADQAPDNETHARGFTCGIGDISTTDTRASASSGGRMVLTCRFKQAD